MALSRITSPDDPSFDALCNHLAERSGSLEATGAWPAEQLAACGAAGVFEWFVAREWGGQAWDEADLLRGYLRISEACLTTAFILTQRVGAVNRIEACQNERAKSALLSDLVAGRTFATVGISHLTTSRRHLAQPVLRAEETADAFVLDGYSPWVTGAAYAQQIVLGATLSDGRQILVAMPTELQGVSIPPAPSLVALSASYTGQVTCAGVRVPKDWLLAGPVLEVMKQGLGARTGGLQTSALALGLASSAIKFLEQEAALRADLARFASELRSDWGSACDAMFAIVSGSGPCTSDDLRAQANNLVLRSTQAALAAAKGAGFVADHSVGRWCRESLFFLVWSCPQPVVQAHLCELAGLA
jgi:alkylation response protein AidB-like acyl-CoA dehydrogenase